MWCVCVMPVWCVCGVYGVCVCGAYDVCVLEGVESLWSITFLEEGRHYLRILGGYFLKSDSITAC